MKRLEDQDNKQAKKYAKSGNHKSLFEGKITINNVEYDKKLCRWSEWKHLPAEEMIAHVRDIAFPFIKTIHNGENTFFAEHMKYSW